MQHLRLSFVLLVLTAAIVTAGCESAPTPQADRRDAPAQHDRLIIAPEAAYDVGYLVGWARDLAVPEEARLTSITLLDDLIVTIEQPSNVITAIQVRDGKTRWRTVVGQPTDQFFPPVRYGEQLLLPSERQVFSLRVEDGGIENIASLEDVVLSSPVLVADTAVFGTATGRVVAHHVPTGFINWQYGLRERISAAPSLVGVNVFAVDNAGEYVLLDARTGQRLWRGSTFDGVVTTAAVDRLNIYVPSLDRSLYAVDRVTGEDQWIYRSQQPLRETPVPLELAVYQPVPQVGLVALNSRSGEPLWTLAEPARAVKLQDENVLLAYGPSKLMTVGTETGDILREAPAARLQQVLEGPDGSIVLVSQDGRLLRLNPRP